VLYNNALETWNIFEKNLE